MEIIKAETELKEMKIERIKGLFTEESKEFGSNLNVIGNCDLLNVKKLPNAKIEKEKFVIQIFGKNIDIEQIRILLKLCRSQVFFTD